MVSPPGRGASWKLLNAHKGILSTCHKDKYTGRQVTKTVHYKYTFDFGKSPHGKNTKIYWRRTMLYNKFSSVLQNTFSLTAVILSSRCTSSHIYNFPRNKLLCTLPRSGVCLTQNNRTHEKLIWTGKNIFGQICGFLVGQLTFVLTRPLGPGSIQNGPYGS